MSKIHKSIAELVGNTPLVELTNYESKYGLKAHIIGKLEFLNPTGSVKDRLALALIRDGEKKGAIKKGDTLIDVTSGNTGIALAGIGHALGYEYVPYLEPGTTIERVQIFEGYGLDLQSFYDIKEVADFEKKVEGTGIPVEVIDMAAYGMMDGEKVVQQAKKLVG
jgi:cysteine synthase A